MTAHLINGNESHLGAVPSAALSSPTAKSTNEIFEVGDQGKMAVPESPKERGLRHPPSGNVVMKHLRENPYVLGLAAVSLSPYNPIVLKWPQANPLQSLPL